MKQKNYVGFANLKHILLLDDISLIKEMLLEEQHYQFALDVHDRMQKNTLNASELGRRLFLSHTIVNKWLQQTARPNGKERMKELGMALGMNEEELNYFLLVNNYTKLYAKNPLDDVCKLTIRQYAGQPDIVQKYRESIQKYNVNHIPLPKKRRSIATSYLSHSLQKLENGKDFDMWLEQYMEHFAASEKKILPSRDLIRFIMLYVGEHSINEMYVTGELPITIRNMLYPLLGDKELALRGLRNKLIVFGLYNNMTEEELDQMLEYAKLLPFTQPGSKTDQALLSAVRCAHERYPYYEYTSLKQRISILSDMIASKTLSKNNHELSFYEQLLRTFETQYQQALQRIEYYDRPQKKGEMERLFETYYTSYSDKGLLHYTKDILNALSEDDTLSKKDVAEYMELMNTQG